MPSMPMQTLVGAALLLAAPPSVCRLMAQTPEGPRGTLGVMAIAVATQADPALANRRLREGYLTQPMLMGALRRGPLRLSGMLNAEGYTLRRGELNTGIYGEGYVDRRHPHTLVHEAMAALVSPGWQGPGGSWQASLAAGRGFTPYGSDDPMVRPFVKYPVNHHHAQIIERVQVLGALRWSGVSRTRGASSSAAGTAPWAAVEHGWFNGDEPTSPFAAPQWRRLGDSRATRLVVAPTPAWEWQASHAFVRSPGIVQGGAFDHRQWSSALRYARPGSRWRYGLIEVARVDEGAGRERAFRYESMLAEGQLALGSWLLSARAERTDRPEQERLLDLFRTSTGHIDFQIVGVTRWTLGTLQLAAPSQRTRVGQLVPFAEIGVAHAAARRQPTVFDPAQFYGRATQWSLSAGLRWHVGAMRSRVGRYGVLADAGDAAHLGTHGHSHDHRQ
ncbi:MAG: hypothetical protein IBJ19_08860 [Gemmatimonadaceae bacterium]|nr:hypothetical protein [Gemmatimonadaceae bacterium]